MTRKTRTGAGTVIRKNAGTGTVFKFSGSATLQEILSCQSCSTYTFLPVLFCLSLLHVQFGLSGLPVQFCMYCPIILVLPWFSCPSSPVEGSPFLAALVQAVLSWQSCPGGPLWRSFQSCSASHVLPAYSACLVLLSSSACHVLTVLF